MSRTLSTNSGSVDSLKVSLRCGCSENAFQIRCTVDGASPDARAMPRELQCVLPTGSVSSVVVTTSATFCSVMVRGAPDRGSSRRPSKRFSAKRRRQVVTVTRVMPSRFAIARLLTPSAASNTISARMASARATLRRRSREASSTASVSDNSIAIAFGVATRCLLCCQEISESYPRKGVYLFLGQGNSTN
jgi:hypothetical protein